MLSYYPSCVHAHSYSRDFGKHAPFPTFLVIYTWGIHIRFIPPPGTAFAMHGAFMDVFILQGLLIYMSVVLELVGVAPVYDLSVLIFLASAICGTFSDTHQFKYVKDEFMKF